MHTVTIDIDLLLFWAGAIAIIATAIVWIKKGMGPVIRPFKKIHELEERSHTCDLKFQNDNRRLDIIEENDRMTMKALMLLLKHAETGNCTGEVAAGRKELEDYLINKE